MDIRIGTRRSDLARFQAKHVGELLQALRPDARISYTFVSSLGDRDRVSTLGALGTVGAFTKESEDALMRNEADLIVHSLKDLPTILPEGLVLAAVPQRHDPRDVMCGIAWSEVTRGSRIGTGSIRRRAQLLHRFPGIDIKPIRGNVPPRLRKAINREGIDATILAFAGLDRLQLMENPSQFSVLPAEEFPYAVGQGALGVESRLADTELLALLRRLEHAPSRAQVDAERALMRRLEAGCSLPIGVLTHCDGQRLSLKATVTKVDGREQIVATREGAAAEAAEIGVALADELLRQGAEPLLREATQWRAEGRTE